jgi:hypothetical protein
MLPVGAGVTYIYPGPEVGMAQVRLVIVTPTLADDLELYLGATSDVALFAYSFIAHL